MHGPAELDYIALSEPLVNILATIRLLGAAGLVAPDESHAMDAAAHALFFKERTYENVLAATGELSAPRRAEIAGLIGVHRRDLKREEAAELVARVAAASDRRVSPPRHWRFEETQIWRELVARWSAELDAGRTADPSVSAAA